MKTLVMHEIRGVAGKNESESGSSKPRRWENMTETKSNALPAATSWALNSDKMGFGGDSIIKRIHSHVDFQVYLANDHHQLDSCGENTATTLTTRALILQFLADRLVGGLRNDC